MENDLSLENQSLFKYHPDMVFSVSLDGTLISANASCQKITGYDREELFKFAPIIVPEEEYFQLTIQGIPQHYEMALVHKKGHIIILRVTTIPNIVGGQIVGIYGVAKDVTEYKQKSKKLRQFQELYHLISENARDIIVVATPDGITRYVSPSIESLLGYAPEEVIGKEMVSFWHPKDRKIPLPKILDIDLLECRIRHKKGHYKWFESTVRVIRNEKGEIDRFVGVGRDITERKNAEWEHRKTKERLESFFKNSADAIWMVDVNDTVLEVNPSFETMFGWKEDEVLGKPLPIIPETLTDFIGQLHQRVKAGESFTALETIRKRKNGDTLFVSATLSPVCDEEGKIIGISGICRDISKRKWIEKEMKAAKEQLESIIDDWKKSQEIIQNSEKLTVAGQFAAGIAHEIRNPITSIKGFLQLLQMEPGQKKEYFEIMASEIERIEMILTELLILAKPNAIRSEHEDLQQLLEQVTALLGTQGSLHNIQIGIEIDPGVPMVKCDRNQIKQVFINFMKNAMEAMPSGGKISILVERKGEDMVLIRFVDEGCGIPEDKLEKIGQPFFTTKEKGTGLGFMISKNIIEDHGGKIQITSKINVGTVIEIELPISN